METTTRLPNSCQYPYLGYNIDHDLVVLFMAPGESFVLHSGSSDLDIGDPIKNFGWEEDFTYFKGEVVLSNS